MAKTILLVEDDEDIATLLRLNLQDEGYQIVHEADGDQALVQLEKQVWDAVILDLMLPGVDGLEMGADDYLAKPFSLLELIARVKALFRRQEAMGQNLLMDAGRLSCHGLSIDPLSREVKLRGEVVDLTPREFDLLYYFARHPGEVFSRLALLEQVWGYQHEGYEHTVNTHINRLRSKIERDPAEPDIILTVWGKGYKFAPMSQEVAP